MRLMRVIDGGITAPEGFNAAGRHIGIKKVKKDIALLTSDVPAKAAGVYADGFQHIVQTVVSQRGEFELLSYLLYHLAVVLALGVGVVLKHLFAYVVALALGYYSARYQIHLGI